MIGIIYFIYLFLIVQIQAQSTDDYYVGAVIEYDARYDDSKTAGKNIQQNIDQYVNYIKDAKSRNTDIIVFPEFGLTTTFQLKNIQLFTTVIPKPEDKICPCDLKNIYSMVLERLSCAARENKMYLVVNLPEREQLPPSKNGVLYFSSTIVFDKNGAIIARYRKYNMNGQFFNTTEKPDLTYFETDFNVTFGIFTTFDILFSQPALELLREHKKITDIVYTTAWESELPFLTGVQIQAGWARANGVNLLAASYSDPQKYYGGSGIYQSNGNISYHIQERKDTTTITTKIKKIRQRNNLEFMNNITANVSKIETASSKLSPPTLQEDMSKYTTGLITENVENREICHENFCCTFKIISSPQEKLDYYYRTVVYDGPRNFSKSVHNVQICGIAACTNESITSCGRLNPSPTNSKLFNEIAIKSSSFIDKGNSVIFPTNVLYNLDILNPSNYIFNSKQNNDYRQIEIKTTTAVKDILGFGIYSLTQDSQSSKDKKGLSGGTIAVIVILVTVVITTISFFVWRRFRTAKYNHPVST